MSSLSVIQFVRSYLVPSLKSKWISINIYVDPLLIVLFFRPSAIFPMNCIHIIYRVMLMFDKNLQS